MQRLFDIIKKEMPQVDQFEIADPPRNAIKISWKINDKSRTSKRVQPIIIEFIDGIDFLGDSWDKFSVKFSAFIRQKNADFKPRTTKNSQESHTPEYWMFPPE